MDFICHTIHSTFIAFSLKYHLFIHQFFIAVDSINIGGIDMRSFYLYTLCFILLVSTTFADLVLKVPIYRYNKETKLWELKTFENIIKYPVLLADSEEKAERSSEETDPTHTNDTKSAQWFYFVEYVISEYVIKQNVRKVEKRYLWADLDQKVGEVAIWNDDKRLYIEFKTNAWSLEETNIMVMSEKPVGNLSPGLFPYSTKYLPRVKKAVCSIPLNWQKGEKVYILAHALIARSSGYGGILKKDAWCGKSDPYMELYLSATKVTWFLKKPGNFFAKVLEGSITSSHQVVMSFSSFENPENGDNQTIPAFYAFTDQKPEKWTPASSINGMEFRFSEGTNTFNMWQKVQLGTQSASVYKNKGVITFTICNTKVYTGD